jgi:hypothetical protein
MDTDNSPCANRGIWNKLTTWSNSKPIWFRGGLFGAILYIVLFIVKNIEVRYISLSGRPSNEAVLQWVWFFISLPTLGVKYITYNHIPYTTLRYVIDIMFELVYSFVLGVAFSSLIYIAKRLLTYLYTLRR